MPVPLTRGEGVGGLRGLPVRARQKGESWGRGAVPKEYL